MLGRREVLRLAGAGAVALAAPAVVTAQAARPKIRIGLGPQQPTQADTKRVWDPVFKWVCEQAGVDYTLTVANDWAGIATALANEQIDIAQMGPWGYVLAKAKGDAKVLAMLTIKGRPYYKAIVTARRDLDLLYFPEDARGLAMQFLDVGSTSGWLVPTHYLRSRGLEPKTYFGKYAEGASAAAAQMAVINGQVDLCTGWDTHRNTMIKNNLIKLDANRVVWESAPLPNEPIAARRNLDPELGQKIQTALAALPRDTAARMMPWPYEGFVPTTHEPYEVLERMGRDVGVLRS
jgi:phosphonate transport system substrate-binding protein